MKKKSSFLVHVCALSVILFVFFVPLLSHADDWKGLVPCSNTATISAGSVTPAGTCDWNALMQLVNKIINFILYTLSIPIAAIMFAYAGFKMVTSGGSAEARGKAKNIFSSTVFGLIFVAVSWLIVKTILSILGYNGTWIGF